MRKILIVGAASAIAFETARRFADNGDELFLVARNRDRLEAIAEDLRGRGAGRVETLVLDVLDYEGHDRLLALASERLSGIDVALIAHGTLPDQKVCESSFEETRRELEINALSVISLLTGLGNYFEKQGHGTLAVFSSVAGDRGRQSNYVYGTAKAAVNVFLQGLRNRLHRSGVRVITLKIGRVDTPMTVGFTKDPSWVQPDRAAAGIYRAIHRSLDVAYVPWFWRIIMLVLRAIPEKLFKRLRL